MRFSATITSSDATTAGSCANSYTITRTFTATDGCGNTATASESFNVTDNTPPVITGVGPGGNVVCPAAPVFSYTNCNRCMRQCNDHFTDATTAGSCANAYTITRTFTATDGCGNTATATESFNVTDNTPPTIIGVGTGGNVVCPAVPVFSTPSATDACGSATITSTDATTAGSCANAYTITRTFTATDGCGNTATATESFNVTDNTPPTIIGVGPGGNVVCPAVPVFSTPSATDACGSGNDHIYRCNNSWLLC